MKQITIGRIVNFVLDGGPNKGRIRPAICVETWGNSNSNFMVFVDGTSDGYPAGVTTVWKVAVPYVEPFPNCISWQGGQCGQHLLEPFTWHWPVPEDRIKLRNALWEGASFGNSWTLYGSMQGSDAIAFGVIIQTANGFDAYRINSDHQGQGGMKILRGTFETLNLAKAAIESELEKSL